MRRRLSSACTLRLLIGGAVAFGVLAPASALAADATFRATPPVAVGAAPEALAVADVNGDGIQDLTVVAKGDDAVVTLAGSGTGSFAVASGASVGSAPHSIAAGDFNGDGFTDFATADFNVKTVTLRYGNGTGGFPTASALSAGVNPQSLVLGDFNRDGVHDLAVANNSSKTVSVFLGTGNGLFDPASAPAVGAYPESLVVGDFNGDGVEDLATANSSDKTVSVLIGSGSGTFTAAASPSVGAFPHGVAMGDFNGDGNQDLATADTDDNAVTVLLGSGNGTFTKAALAPPTGAYPIAIAVGDLNGDGSQDLVTANRDAASVTVLMGNGSGSFTPAPSVPVGAAPLAVVIGDFNGDGVEDLATANNGAKTVSVLLGNGSATGAGNLLANPGAEGPGAAGTSALAPAFGGWTRTTGTPTFVRYSTPAFPSFIDAARWGGGSGFFAGGPGAAAAAQQTVSVADRAASIDAGLATARLSGLLGGYLGAADAASVTAEFLSASGQRLGTALTIGPVTAAERRNQTVLLRRTALGPLPAGTRQIQVTMGMTRASGAFDDGYLDDLSLALTAPAPPAVASGGPVVVSAFAMTSRRFHVARPGRPVSAPRNPAGTTFRYTLSAGARVTIAIERLRLGRRRADGRCVALTPRRPVRRCLRAAPAGALSTDAAGGAGSTRFTGRLKGRRLAPGRYRATITATVAGLAGPARRLTFSITR